MFANHNFKRCLQPIKNPNRLKFVDQIIYLTIFVLKIQTTFRFLNTNIGKTDVSLWGTLSDRSRNVEEKRDKKSKGRGGKQTYCSREAVCNLVR